MLPTNCFSPVKIKFYHWICLNFIKLTLWKTVEYMVLGGSRPYGSVVGVRNWMRCTARKKNIKSEWRSKFLKEKQSISLGVLTPRPRNNDERRQFLTCKIKFYHCICWNFIKFTLWKTVKHVVFGGSRPSGSVVGVRNWIGFRAAGKKHQIWGVLKIFKENQSFSLSVLTPHPRNNDERRQFSLGLGPVGVASLLRGRGDDPFPSMFSSVWFKFWCATISGFWSSTIRQNAKNRTLFNSGLLQFSALGSRWR